MEKNENLKFFYYSLFLSQVTVIIKGRGTFCTQEKTYEAQSDQPLQASFVDGTHTSGPNQSVMLKLEEIDKNHQVVEIYLKYIETTLVIRQVGVILIIIIRLRGRDRDRGGERRERGEKEGGGD